MNESTQQGPTRDDAEGDTAEGSTQAAAPSLLERIWTRCGGIHVYSPKVAQFLGCCAIGFMIAAPIWLTVIGILAAAAIAAGIHYFTTRRK